MENFIRKATGTYLNTLAVLAPSVMARQSFQIFCHPVKATFKQHHQEFLNSAEKFKYEFESKKIQVYKWGKGPKKILFLHGWQSHSFQWKNYVKAFSWEEYTMYSIDAPAHGASEGKLMHLPMYGNLVTNFIKDYGYFDAVITHSMGGLCILYSLHEDSTLQIGKIVLMGAPGRGTDFLNFYKNALDLSDKAIELTQQYFENKTGKSISDFSSAKCIQGLQNKGLIIHDLGDHDAPYRYAEELHKLWPNSELITTRGLGHKLKSPKIVEAVKEFVSSKNGVSEHYINLAS